MFFENAKHQINSAAFAGKQRSTSGFNLDLEHREDSRRDQIFRTASRTNFRENGEGFQTRWRNVFSRKFSPRVLPLGEKTIEWTKETFFEHTKNKTVAGEQIQMMPNYFLKMAEWFWGINYSATPFFFKEASRLVLHLSGIFEFFSTY